MGCSDLTLFHFDVIAKSVSDEAIPTGDPGRVSALRLLRCARNDRNSLNGYTLM